MSKLKNDISIDWNDGNASVVYKLLQELGYPMLRPRGYESREGWSYFGRSGDSVAFQGVARKNKHHFTSLEDFLKYHFSEEKSLLEVEFEELQAQIKTLSEKAAEIKAKLN